MTELTLNMHVVERSTPENATFSAVAVTLNRQQINHFSYLAKAAKALKADVSLPGILCQTDAGEHKEMTVTINPASEIDFEVIDPVLNDWPIRLSQSGYLLMTALLEAFTWAEKQSVDVHAFLPRDSRSLHLATSNALNEDANRHYDAIEALNNNTPESFYHEFCTHSLEQPFTAHKELEKAYNTDNSVWPAPEESLNMDASRQLATCTNENETYWLLSYGPEQAEHPITLILKSDTALGADQVSTLAIEQLAGGTLPDGMEVSDIRISPIDASAHQQIKGLIPTHHLQ